MLAPCSTTQQSPQISSPSVAPASLLTLLQSDQFLALKPNCNGWLLLQKVGHADLVGPGSAVGNQVDGNYRDVCAIGSIDFYVPPNGIEPQQSLHRRITSIQCLQKILVVPSSLQRAQLMLQQLSHWLGQSCAQAISDDWVAQLAAVAPATVAAVRMQHGQTHRYLLPEKGFNDFA